MESALDMFLEFFFVFFYCCFVVWVEGLEEGVGVIVVFFGEEHALEGFVVAVVPGGFFDLCFYSL